MGKCSKTELRRPKTALHWKIPPSQRERIQMVLLRESGMTQPAIAAAMGVSLSTVNRAHMAYDQDGIKALKPKPNGGRKHENMTLAEEKALLARFAKSAGAGEMLNMECIGQQNCENATPALDRGRSEACLCHARSRTSLRRNRRGTRTPRRLDAATA